MLKLMADECIHNDVILALRQNGFDVLTIKEAGLTGSDDEIIFNFAQDKQRILLTFDRSFGDIFHFNITKSSGVIIVLISQMTKNEVINILLNFLNLIKNQGIDGKLVIIGKTKIRISGR